MKQIKWTTISSWVEETIELFTYIDEDFNIAELSKKVNEGEIFSNRKLTSAKRVFGAIKSRYLNNDRENIIGLARVLRSNISEQEKKNYLLIFYLEYETLAQLFMESYVYDNFNKYHQKIYTQMDLDRFFEIVLDNYHDYLPSKQQEYITTASLVKVRNVLYKNLENFGWVEAFENKINIKRPSLTPEWLVFTLHLFFKEDHINTRDVHTSNFYKRFLLNEFDIEYLLTGARLKGLVSTNKLGDIDTITKSDKGLIEYAKRYQ